MPKVEYRVVTIDAEVFESNLKELGDEGWQIAALLYRGPLVEEGSGRLDRSGYQILFQRVTSFCGCKN